jgi:hypothetical protein
LICCWSADYRCRWKASSHKTISLNPLRSTTQSAQAAVVSPSQDIDEISLG